MTEVQLSEFVAGLKSNFGSALDMPARLTSTSWLSSSCRKN